MRNGFKNAPVIIGNNVILAADWILDLRANEWSNKPNSVYPSSPWNTFNLESKPFSKFSRAAQNVIQAKRANRTGCGMTCMVSPMEAHMSLNVGLLAFIISTAPFCAQAEAFHSGLVCTAQTKFGAAKITLADSYVSIEGADLGPKGHRFSHLSEIENLVTAPGLSVLFKWSEDGKGCAELTVTTRFSEKEEQSNVQQVTTEACTGFGSRCPIKN
jgi:hypothetical protein